ncbi:MAG: DUF493 domain-containing protein [Nevskia sp.]|jgi:hypothetical protein|nr:DUF493 domain-containing protein [Nevskia sp.]MCK9384666.1 DUF493 domain-containing protein [Nevskia sp.]
MAEPSENLPAPPPGLVYPCEFPLKIFVHPDPETEARIAELAHAQLAVGATITVTRRMSSGGKYAALTLNFIAEDAAHLDRVIKAVTADPGVILAL